MATYVKINKETLEWISKNLVGRKEKVEDWSWGDVYPEIVEQKIIPENIEKEIKTALKRNTYTTVK